MEFVIGWSLGGILLCVMFYIVTFFHRKNAERKKEREFEEYVKFRLYKKQRQQEFLRLITYNREHMPSADLPSLDPDWTAADGFIMETRFRFTDEGERFAYHVSVNNSYETKYILKSDFDSDTLRIIELLRKDVDWFCANPIAEVMETLTNFLREKYPGLSESSISRICHTYCTDNR